jgi:hypothetical protein
MNAQEAFETLNEIKDYAETRQFCDNKKESDAAVKLFKALETATDAAEELLNWNMHEINDADMNRENFNSNEDFEEAQI